MDPIELACPFCAGRFQTVAAAAESHVANCPHCGRPVTVPAGGTPGVFDGCGGSDRTTPFAEPQSVPPNPSKPRLPFDLVEPTKTVVNRRGEAVVLRRRSPEERARYQRRLNLALAAIGMAILAFALVVLLRIRP